MYLSDAHGKCVGRAWTSVCVQVRPGAWIDLLGAHLPALKKKISRHTCDVTDPVSACPTLTKPLSQCIKTKFPKQSLWYKSFRSRSLWEVYCEWCIGMTCCICLCSSHSSSSPLALARTRREILLWHVGGEVWPETLDKSLTPIHIYHLLNYIYIHVKIWKFSMLDIISFNYNVVIERVNLTLLLCSDWVKK